MLAITAGGVGEPKYITQILYNLYEFSFFKICNVEFVINHVYVHTYRMIADKH